MVKTPNFYYGNLQSYKFSIRPTAYQLYGSPKNLKSNTHQKIVHKLLKILALRGTTTTWEMAKIVFPDNRFKIKIREKEYRRLFLGRIDRGKYSQGILDRGLIVQEEKSYRNNPTFSYRLSLHGVLYCLDVLELTTEEIDVLASKYAKILPRVFGKWSELKKILQDDVYCLHILSKGLLLDNPPLGKQLQSSVYELMTFLNIKYRKNYDYITEYDLAEEISYWFYTYLLYSPPHKNKKRISKVKKLNQIFRKDEKLKKWFLRYAISARQYYSKHEKNLSVFFNNFQEVA